MINIKNTKEIAKKILEAYCDGRSQELNNVLRYLDSEKTKINEMIKEDFIFEFNNFFAQKVASGDVDLIFPKQIKINQSVWFMSWNNYFDEKFKNHDEELRGIDFDLLKEEKQKLCKMISVVNSNDKFQVIEESLLGSDLYGSDKKQMYKKALKVTIFMMVKIEKLNHDYESLEDNLKTIINAYYSGFDNESNELYKTQSYMFKKGQNLNQIRANKCDYFDIKNRNESLFISEISRNKDIFSIAFNKEVGLDVDDKSLSMKDFFYNMGVRINHEDLLIKIKEKNKVAKKDIIKL